MEPLDFVPVFVSRPSARVPRTCHRLSFLKQSPPNASRCTAVRRASLRVVNRSRLNVSLPYNGEELQQYRRTRKQQGYTAGSDFRTSSVILSRLTQKMPMLASKHAWIRWLLSVQYAPVCAGSLLYPRPLERPRCWILVSEVHVSSLPYMVAT